MIALDAGAWWAAASPLLMSKREGYADYVRRTSGFIPVPPRTKAARIT